MAKNQVSPKTAKAATTQPLHDVPACLGEQLAGQRSGGHGLQQGAAFHG